MAVQPNTNGYLGRSTNLPANGTSGTGWTVAFWMRLTNTPASSQVVFNLDNGSGAFVQLNFASSAALRLETELGVQTTVATLTVGTWYFLAIRNLSLTTVQVANRSDSAFGLGTSAVCTVLNGTWANMHLLSNAGSAIAADVQIAFAKLYSGAGAQLSVAQMWEVSARQLPKLPTATLDSYMPLLGASGADEGGQARDWTVTGTLAAVAEQPRISRGGSGARYVTPAGASMVTMSGPLAVAASIQSPASLSIQPVTMGGAIALAAAALQPAITYPVTLGGAVAVAAAIQAPAAASIQPVSMGGPLAVAADVQTPLVGAFVAPSVVSALETPQQPAAASIQPVTLAAALQLALTVQQPALTIPVIQVSGPAPIVLGIPQPAADDPYPHDFARRTRRDSRRAKMS